MSVIEPTEIKKAVFDEAVRDGRIKTPLRDGDTYGAVYQPWKRAYGVLTGKPVWCWVTVPAPNPEPVDFPLELARETA